MSSKGPSPQPENLRLLRGVTPRPSSEPIPAAVPVEPPADLSAAALAVWTSLAPDLIARGVLDAWAVQPFVRLCWLAAKSMQLRAEIDATGDVVAGARNHELVRNPRWAVLRQVDAELVQLESRFGLTPADRTRVRSHDDDAGHPFDDLLS